MAERPITLTLEPLPAPLVSAAAPTAVSSIASPTASPAASLIASAAASPTASPAASLATSLTGSPNISHVASRRPSAGATPAASIASAATPADAGTPSVPIHDGIGPVTATWLRRLALALVFLAAFGFGRPIWQAVTSSRSEIAADYVVNDDATPSPGCHETGCTVTTLSKRSARRGIEFVARLVPIPSQKIVLPSTFNRAFPLAIDMPTTPSDWQARQVPGGAYQIPYIWWAGSQRFANIPAPGPGYLRALISGDGSPAVPVSRFVTDRQGFKLDALKPDDPSPYQFLEAEFQPVPVTLSVVIANSMLAGLGRGDKIEFGQKWLPLIPHHLGSMIGTVTAVNALPSEAGYSQVDMTLSEDARRTWEQVLFALESTRRSVGQPVDVDLTLSRTGSAVDGQPSMPGVSGQFVWLPRESVVTGTERERGFPIGSVWTVIGESLVPIRVLIGASDSRDGDQVAVIEAPPAGMMAAVAYDDWQALSPVQRQAVLRTMVIDPKLNRHLREDQPIVAAPSSALKAGAPARVSRE